MSMRKSGEAVRELLLALWGISDADLALAELEEIARTGGEPAVVSVRRVVTTSRKLQWSDRERLQEAYASIRAMVGQVMPGDARQVMDPPAGHIWTTSTGAQGRFTVEDKGRLYCSTCTMTDEDGERVRYAAECLARVRADQPEPEAPCAVCGVVHP